MCGHLQTSMYGTRGAAQNWAHKYERVFKEIGAEQGKASPCNFYHPFRVGNEGTLKSIKVYIGRVVVGRSSSRE